MAEGIFFVVKILVTVLLSPVVYSCAVNFFDHVDSQFTSYGDFFTSGVIGFVLVFLFLHRFGRVYRAAQAATASAFHFLAPLDRVLARLIPLYTTVILVTLFVVSKFTDKVGDYTHYFFFFAGFAFGMHILLVAQDIQEEETSFLKPSYLCQMTLYFILSCLLVVLLLDLAVWKFTLGDFILAVFDDARDVYLVAWHKIF